MTTYTICIRELVEYTVEADSVDEAEEIVFGTRDSEEREQGISYGLVAYEIDENGDEVEVRNRYW